MIATAGTVEPIVSSDLKTEELIKNERRTWRIIAEYQLSYSTAKVDCSKKT